MSDYASRIRAARAYADMTQEQLAEHLGVDPQTIKRRENGRQEPRRGELLAIAAVTGVPTGFMEYGFGEVEANEVLERLDRIEAALVDDTRAAVDATRSVKEVASAGAGAASTANATAEPVRDEEGATEAPPRAGRAGTRSSGR